MTVREFMEKLPTMDEVERKTLIQNLWPRLTLLSRNTMLRFQATWDGSQSWEEFRKSQDEELLECLKLEVSEIGKDVHNIIGGEPLTLETEI